MTTTTPRINLYYKTNACSLVPHALLRHLNVPFHGIPMAPDAEGKYTAADGSFTHQDYLKLNPAGYVPALGLADGTIITEMPAVLTYIVNIAAAEQLKNSNTSSAADTAKSDGEVMGLLGRTAQEKAQVIQWMAYLSGTLHSLGFASQWRPERFVGEHPESFGHIRQQGRVVIEKAFARIEEGLQGKEFLVGNRLTVVDLNLYVFSRWAGEVQIEMDKTYENYSKAMKRVEGLDGVKRMLQIEGLESCFGG